MRISYLAAYSLAFFSSSAALVAGTCTCSGGTSDDFCLKFTSNNISFNSEDACDTFCKTDAECGKYENAKGEYSDTDDCFSGSALLYSCTQHKYVAARTIKVGDAVRAMAAVDGAPTCSEVYHVYQHTEKADNAYEAYAIELEGHDAALEVSSNHMVYVGESYKDRHAVRAASVMVGDRLVALQGSSVVTGIKAVPVPDLVNILTYEPVLHVGTNEENPVIVSAYSYNEFYYHYFYATPLRAAYSAFGNRFEAVQLSAMKTAEEYVAKPFLRAVIS